MFENVRIMRKAVLVLSATLTIMAGAAISPALPFIEHAFADLPYSTFIIMLMLTTPALFIVVSSPVIGLCVDWFGRKWLLIGALLLYGVSGSSGLWVESLPSLFIGRMFLGIATGGVMTTVITLIADYYEGAERETMMGLKSAFIGFGGVFFVLLSGALATFGWRAPFAVYLFALVLIPLAFLYIIEPKDVEAVAAEKIEHHHTDPIPWGQVMVIYGLVFWGMVCLYVIPVKVPFFLEELIHASPIHIGMTLAVPNLSGALSALFYRQFHRFLNYQLLMALVFLMIGLGFLALAFASSWAGVTGSLLLCGIGFGLLVPNCAVLITRVAPVHVRGRLVGGLSMCLFLGQFFAPIVVEPLYLDKGFSGVFGAFGIIGMIAIAISALFTMLEGLRVKSFLTH
ncbi:MAG: MFS transporter [Chlamydiales bacterium]|nr:MFS transporter [Chlamydiia bacterium]MCP5508586.1 MFS transporter [Chlamydiales bacterium]